MKRQLETTLNSIKTQFGKRSFTVAELYEVLKHSEADLPLSTLRWRLYSLKASDEIEAQARGTYALSSRTTIDLKLSPDLSKISKELRAEFPHAKLCVWSSEFLNQFTIHQPSVSYTIIEAERDVLESVFSFLQRVHKNILLNPSKKEVDHYLLTKTKSIIVKPLIQRAPLTTDPSKNAIPSLEKILIDLLAEPDVFSLYQGSELKNIWKEVYHKYPINFSTLNNYARRRNLTGDVEKILQELNLPTYHKEKSNDPA